MHTLDPIIAAVWLQLYTAFIDAPVPAMATVAFVVIIFTAINQRPAARIAAFALGVALQALAIVTAGLVDILPDAHTGAAAIRSIAGRDLGALAPTVSAAVAVLMLLQIWESLAKLLNRRRAATLVDAEQQIRDRNARRAALGIPVIEQRAAHTAAEQRLRRALQG